MQQQYAALRMVIKQLANTEEYDGYEISDQLFHGLRLKNEKCDGYEISEQLIIDLKAKSEEYAGYEISE